MAIGFNLSYNYDSWFDISNPTFVFTSPNMDQGCDAGTRSHMVAGELSMGMWIEDTVRNKMYMWMPSQTESMTYPYTVHSYNYDDYSAYYVSVSSNVSTPCSKIYISSRPTASISGKKWLVNPTVSANGFDATSISCEVSNWWKLNEDSGSVYADSVGSMPLASSGVSPIYYSAGFYAPLFDGNGMIYSSTVLNLQEEFGIAFCVDSYGATSSGVDSFGYNSTFVNVVDTAVSGTYFDIGISESDTLVYSIRTDVAEFKSDTGVAMVSGTFSSIVATYKEGNGFYLYKDNNAVTHNATVTGNLASGILCIGNTGFGHNSTFRGSISDVKYWNGTLLSSNDVNESYIAGQLVVYPTVLFGSSTGTYTMTTGDQLFYGFPTYKNDLHHSDSLSLIMEFGEAYNCYITAWDDGTHSTTSNVALTNELCKLSAAIYRTDDAGSGWPSEDPQGGAIVKVYDFASDFPIKGNDLYYGKFDLVYYVREQNKVGDIVCFRPRIQGITSTLFSPGVYDFVITFHYQYT